MTNNYTVPVAKKLAFKFILDNIEYKKRCMYLQEIIEMGKGNDVWMKALTAFFDTPLNKSSLRAFSKN